MRVAPRNLVKPVIQLVGGVWTCHRPIDPVINHTGRGKTPEMAYKDWRRLMLTKSLLLKPID